MSHPEGSHPPEDETIDLRAYARPIWRWKWIIVAVVILAAGGTYALTSQEHKTYTATTRVYVEDADPAESVSITAPTSTTPPSQQALQNIAELFTDQGITNAVYHRLGVRLGDAGSVVVSPESTSSFVDLTASSSSAALAARLANTYVSVFLASQSASVASTARRDAAAAQATLRIVDRAGGQTRQAQAPELLEEIDQYDTIARDPSPGAQQVDSALAPASPSSPKPTRDAVFAGLIGLLLGIGLSFVLDPLDRRLRRVSSVHSLYGRPVIAILPRLSRAAERSGVGAGSPSEFVEVMRALRVNLRLGNADKPPRSVLVTSGLPAEGKSTVARNLAFAYADAGERVLLIDCDLRRPSVARVFGIDPEAGLAQVLRREARPADAAVTVFRTSAASTGEANGSTPAGGVAGDPRLRGTISVITHGEQVQSPVALLSSPAMSNLLTSATATYDVVILDTSPILTVSDAIPLLDQVGAVVFVARLGMTTRDVAGRLAELGQRIPRMNLVGIVVNDVRNGEGYSQYGYDYARTES